MVILVRGERPEKFASPSGKNEVVVIASTGILGDVYNNAYPVRCKWFYNYHKPGVSDSWIGSGSWNNFDIDWTDPDRAVIRLGDDEEDSYAEIIVIF
ncbi:MAG: hypothetical protein FWF08_03655 [Oscillospiraceae bacterium]|nr:hypothetical protein [Oscillospiraceae bacterium]